MTLQPLDFGIRSNPGEYGFDGGSRHVNARVEDIGEEGKQRLIIKNLPGLDPFATIPGGGPCRGLIPLGDTLYVISGNILVPVDRSGTVGQQIGGIPGDGPLSWAINQHKTDAGNPSPQIALVSEGFRAILEGNVLSPITSTNLPPPIHVLYIDGFFAYIIADGRVFFSGINDGHSISALDLIEANGAPDGLVGGAVRGREIFLIGEVTTEVWQTAATTTGAPAVRLPGVFLETGCAAQFTIQEFADSIAWVSNRTDKRPFQVVMLDGYEPRRISNYAVERALEDLDDISTLKAYTTQENGHSTYVLRSDTWAFGFDSVAGWHDLESYQLPSSRRLFAAPFADKLIVGDAFEGKLHVVDRDIYTEDGDPLVWTIRSPPQHAYPHRLEIKRAYFDLLPGVGLPVGSEEDTDPKVMVRWSDDGWHSVAGERQLALGKLGDRTKRVTTRKLGKTRGDGRSWELSVSANVARAWLGSQVGVKVLKP